jgi:hypothetical protein
MNQLMEEWYARSILYWPLRASSFRFHRKSALEGFEGALEKK